MSPQAYFTHLVLDSKLPNRSGLPVYPTELSYMNYMDKFVINSYTLLIDSLNSRRFTGDDYAIMIAEALRTKATLRCDII